VNRGRLRHVFRRALRGFAIQIPDAAARALANDPRVAYVEEDGVVTATSITQSNATWGLDRLDQRALPLNTQFSYATDGTGVNVYVIDSGVRVSHTEFGGRAFIGGDFIDDDFDGDPSDVGNDDANSAIPDGYDCNGHGTHVAGTIGGAMYGVAKNVTVWAHRVLDCQGAGSVSGVIAAVDAITEAGRRPAVVNMSLGGPASTALDSAIRRSIAAGFTYVVAAGNDNIDASASSPARVTEAITVGATASNDVRASFSNFGQALDVFAPGVSIRSAGIASDIATTTLSGTSMAAPHVAGIAALYLQTKAADTPAAVRNAIVTGATPGIVGGAGIGSPNLLAYSGILAAVPTPPTVSVRSPNGGEKLFTAAPYVVEWTAADDDGLASFTVEVSTNNGTSYSPVSGCTSLPAAARHCAWSTPGPATSTARIRVVATDMFGATGSDASDGAFTIASGSPSVTVTAPNAAVNWGRGSRQQIKWSHNLGTNSYVRIEISRDGGVTYSDVAPVVKNSSSGSGVFDWVVTEPNTSAALIRISWTAGAASDVANVPFTIADPYILVPKPAAGTSWGYDTQQLVGWKTNLGPADRVNVLLSTDGGRTFVVPLASGLGASTNTARFATPVLPSATTTARVRVAWANAPGGVSLMTSSPANFRVEPPFVKVAAPNGGETLIAGTSTTIRWVHNLGSLDNVRIDLSLDGGQTYPTVVSATTASDGSHAVVPTLAWATTAARVRIAWLKNAATVVDVSDAVFQVR
jgi:hypothetical protein